MPEVVRDSRVSSDGRVYTFELKRTFHFHTGRGGHGPQLCGRLQPGREPADGVMGIAVHARDRWRSRRHGEEGEGDLRSARAGSLPAADPADQTGWRFTARLTLPFFCPVLPDSPVDPAGMNNPPGSGPYYVAERIVEPADRAEAESLLPRAIGRRTSIRSSGRSARARRPACSPPSRTGSTTASRSAGRAYRTPRQRLAKQYGVNRPGGQFFVGPRLQTVYLAFNHDRPAFKGPGQIALKKAINYAVDRPELARAFGYLGGRRTDQLVPPALGRDSRIYPLEGADPVTARKWLAKAKLKPPTLVLYSHNNPLGIAIAETLRFNLKQIGIELDVKYYDPDTAFDKAGTRGEPFDIVLLAWSVDYADPAGFFVPLLNPELRDTGGVNRAYFARPWVSARIDAANRLSGEARRKAWADLDADLMRDDPPWAPLVHTTDRSFVSRSLGCFRTTPSTASTSRPSARRSRWRAGSRSRWRMLAVGAALLVAAGVAWSAGSAEAPKGGTLRLGTAGTSTSSIRRSAYSRVVVDRVCDLREAVQLPGRAGCGGDAAGSGGGRRRPGSRATAGRTRSS